MNRIAAGLFSLATLGLSASCASRPAEPSADRIEITLVRGSCLGACAEYEVRISNDGVVRYRGLNNVNVRGEARHSVSRPEVMALVSRFGQLNFMSWQPAYGRATVEQQALAVTLQAGARSHTVSNSGGLGAGAAPPNLAVLAEEIDRVAGSARWTVRDGGAQAQRAAPSGPPGGR